MKKSFSLLKYVPKEKQQSAKAFNLSSYYFETKQFRKIPALLREVELDSPVYAIQSRFILQAASYELEPFDLLFHQSQIKALKAFVQNAKNISDSNKATYLKSLKIFQGLLTAKKPAHIEKLEQFFAQSRAFYQNEWLEEKLKEKKESLHSLMPYVKRK